MSKQQALEHKHTKLSRKNKNNRYAAPTQLQCNTVTAIPCVNDFGVRAWSRTKCTLHRRNCLQSSQSTNKLNGFPRCRSRVRELGAPIFVRMLFAGCAMRIYPEPLAAIVNNANSTQHSHLCECACVCFNRRHLHLFFCVRIQMGSPSLGGHIPVEHANMTCSSWAHSFCISWACF